MKTVVIITGVMLGAVAVGITAAATTEAIATWKFWHPRV